MLDSQIGFISPTFLRAAWHAQFEAFRNSEAEAGLLAKLKTWAKRKDLGESSAQPAFISTFFVDLWGYYESGTRSGADFTLIPQFAVSGAGAGGGTGSADLAMGLFGNGQDIPQVLCEYKDIRTNLDAEQKRKGNRRSPVRQALDYLSNARRGFVGSEPIVPTWAIVSDMNEFRLYWYDRGGSQHIRFVIQPQGLFDGEGLLADTEGARFSRFLFSRIFHSELLLTPGGRSELLRLVHDQRVRNRQIEETFYFEYRSYREALYGVLLDHNGPGTARFPGTKGKLVRMAQKLLDRLLFVAFCDDMGQRLNFPPKQLRNLLMEQSNLTTFDPDDDAIWGILKRLFKAMNDGHPFAGNPMHKFNGGLFAPDAELDALRIPNRIFCQKRQGSNEASIAAHKLTALYLVASYNYAADLGGSTEKSLGLYTLGRIFEQSITELEILEAAADERESLNLLSKRKRDGVYYTPEWVVELIVSETFEPIFGRLREDAGWASATDDDPSLEAVDAYLKALSEFTLCDPACGSGAFLVTALRHLVMEWRNTRLLRRRIAGKPDPRAETEAQLVTRLLRENVHGIDINPSSVEITQLALWLHTASRDATLADLSATIRCGNSLVTADFYKGRMDDFYDAEAREQINTFDWRVDFPTVAERGGFDAIIGNPPYVKLQNFRSVFPEVADYLVHGNLEAAQPYASTRTGNFDLYLPFIEQGLRMLRPRGRLGYIAPNIWVLNESGAGLRNLIRTGRNLDGWLDFVSHQIFEEATTYTALQFFTKEPTPGIRVARAPDGVLRPGALGANAPVLAWGDQEFGDRWLMLAGPERALLDRLRKTCLTLGDRRVTSQVFVGIQTSADSVYHLTRLAPGRFRAQPPAESLPGMPKPKKGAPLEVDIEDEIMRPLVSGAEAKRYQAPRSGTWLLFPYEMQGEAARLIPAEEMRTRFPKAWAYLSRFETTLRRREAKKNKDGALEGPFVTTAEWHAFGRNQSLAKQHLPKLIVAQTVPSMRVCFDDTGGFALNNVRVNGILAQPTDAMWFLLGVLNGPIVDFVFRRIAKSKDSGWFEANKQFIEPLPIPPATAEEQAAIAAQARKLQALHTERRDTLVRIQRRVSAAPTRPRDPTWLFAGLSPLAEFAARAPAKLDSKARAAWAKAAFDEARSLRETALRDALQESDELTADLVEGELRLLCGGQVLLDRIFPTATEAPFLLAQWTALLSGMTITARLTGRKLAERLCAFAASDNPGLVQQVLEQANALSNLDAQIKAAETALNEALYNLYGLSPEERALVAAG